MQDKKLGVFICHCGGNISDVVDVEAVRAAVEGLPGVEVAKTNMFSCSEAAQSEMISLIKEHQLDGIVIASCSPKLHLQTFREMAKKAGLNPYQYIQVNIREQCSWAHPHHKEEATQKAIRLVRAGIARALEARALKAIETKIHPEVLVIGGGLSGMEAALSLARMGIKVHLVEKEEALGGLLRGREPIFPTEEEGQALVETLAHQIENHPNIKVYLGAEVIEKKGSVGDFSIGIKVGEGRIELKVGAIIVATGAKPYAPQEGEFGYGSLGVCTLAEFLNQLDLKASGLSYKGRPIRRLAYLYCVGAREEREGGRKYCARYCCTAAVHTAWLINQKWPEVHQYHLYRDIRTYGVYEDYYKRALEGGSVFLRYSPKAPPEVQVQEDGSIKVRVKDLLTSKEEVEIETDLLCLVTGLEPRPNEDLSKILKIQVGKDGFFNEVHPKLRPVETMVEGVFICGCAQGPKTAEESAISALAAASKAGAMILSGVVTREPLVAEVIEERCDGCGLCIEACPYEALTLSSQVVQVNESLCKGEGACVPVCPRQAIQIKGFEHETVEAMIEALLEGENA